MGNAEGGGLCKPKAAPREVVRDSGSQPLCSARRASSADEDEKPNEFDEEEDWSARAAEKLADACTAPRRAQEPKKSYGREDTHGSDEGAFDCAGGARALAGDLDDFVKLHSREKQSGTMEMSTLDDLQNQYISQWAIDLRARGYDNDLRTNVVADTPSDLLVTQNKNGHCSLRSEETVHLDDPPRAVQPDLCSAKSGKEKQEGRAKEPERTPEINDQTSNGKAGADDVIETTYQSKVEPTFWASFDNEDETPRQLVLAGREAGLKGTIRKRGSE